MNQNKKGSTNNLTCDVCKIIFNANADYALHEFSKKHCDNLIRLAKQKPIVSKQKTKSEGVQAEKEEPKINSVTHTGSFSKYGYFVPGEIYANAETSKEFNIDYDPYLQKFAENPFKEKPSIPSPSETIPFCSTTSFSKKKKNKIKTCQVCNVTLSTVPEYETHMKSPQHIWKLKVTGMGVSAHFVKASTDLHTTEVNEGPKAINPMDEQPQSGTTSSSGNPLVGPFPLLYCSDCELLLNSPQQYNAHINGKAHIECSQKKAELKAKKEKLENPSPHQLYCYSCKISLNNLFQYNEHRNGKKHKTKCRNLIRKGITIPPEERIPGIPLPNPNKPVVYPELYEKLILEKQKQSIVPEDENIRDTAPELLTKVNSSNQESDKATINPANVVEAVENYSEMPTPPKIIFHRNCQTSEIIKPNESETNSTDLSVSKEKKDTHTIVTDKPVQCSICHEEFQWQSKLDTHLSTEDHYKKILQLKQNGTSESDLLAMIFSDRNVIKPSFSGKLTCSICNVTTDGRAEFDQHLNSIVHKYTQKDYKTKRTLEVKYIVASNEQGAYYCKLCNEGWPSLVDYIQHLHFIKHKSIQREQRAKVMLAKKRSKQRAMQNLRKNISRRMNTEKNPGVRTKVCGIALDLNSGAQAPIPNLEPLEPKIDVTKNVSIGVEVPCNNNNNEQVRASNMKKRYKTLRSNRVLQNNRPYPKNVPPFVPSRSIIPPPLMSENPFHPRFLRPNYVPVLRYRTPFSSPYSPVFEPFCGRPQMGNLHFRPPWLQRPPWPGYR